MQSSLSNVVSLYRVRPALGIRQNAGCSKKAPAMPALRRLCSTIARLFLQRITNFSQQFFGRGRFGRCGWGFRRLRNHLVDDFHDEENRRGDDDELNDRVEEYTDLDRDLAL